MAVAALDIRSKEGHHVSPIKLVAICTALFSLCMISLGSEIERKAIAVVKATYTAAQAGQPATLTAAPDSDAKLGIIRNNFLMFIIAGGAFGGAVTCVCLRMAYASIGNKVLGKPILGAYFTVSLMTSFFCTPTIMKKWFSEAPEDCLTYSFLVAVGSWGAWEVVAIILDRLKLAATYRGIAGLKEELTGNTRDVTGVPSNPTPTPNVPGSKEEKL
jgi:hypothetical protein